MADENKTLPLYTNTGDTDIPEEELAPPPDMSKLAALLPEEWRKLAAASSSDVAVLYQKLTGKKGKARVRRT